MWIMSCNNAQPHFYPDLTWNALRVSVQAYSILYMWRALDILKAGNHRFTKIDLFITVTVSRKTPVSLRCGRNQQSFLCMAWIPAKTSGSVSSACKPPEMTLSYCWCVWILWSKGLIGLCSNGTCGFHLGFVCIGVQCSEFPAEIRDGFCNCPSSLL